jgi:hypothetical protein
MRNRAHFMLGWRVRQQYLLTTFVVMRSGAPAAHDVSISLMFCFTSQIEVDVHRAGQRVSMHIEAASRSLLIWQEGSLLKTVPLRGFSAGTCSFARFVEHMM